MLIEGIETITYDEAAKMLGISISTLHGATSRGMLTPLPRRARKPGRLAKQQVEMFVDRNLSLKWLSPEELERWHVIEKKIQAIRRMPNTPDNEPPTPPTAPSTPPRSDKTFLEVPDTLEEKLSTVLAGLEAMANIDEEIAARIGSDVTLNDVANLTDYIMQVPSFKPFAAMFGIDMSTLTDETKQAARALAGELVKQMKPRYAVEAKRAIKKPGTRASRKNVG